MVLTEIAPAVKADGYAIVEDVLSIATVNQLVASLEQEQDNTGSFRKRSGIFAIRNLLDLPSIRHLATTSAIRALVEPILGEHAFPVRGILFDKIPDANWKVPWHQDVTIAVQTRVEAEGFGPWSMKANVLHVQPPAHVFEHMISVRLHLDICSEANGALRVIPGSHLSGRIPEADIPSLTRPPGTVCEVGVGGALLMRPLLLHTSSPSQCPGHRRVIHLDFASVRLPNGIRWAAEA